MILIIIKRKPGRGKSVHEIPREKSEKPPENLIFDYPPREIVKELELYCTIQKVRLNIYHSSGKKP